LRHSAGKISFSRETKPSNPVGTKVFIKIQPFQESVLQEWQRWVRALGALGFVFCGLAGQPAYADGSVSSLRMGYGAPDAAAFARFQNVIQQYNASGERFRIESHCQSACTMFLSIRNVCVTPGATLLFHAGGSMQKGTISPARTQECSAPTMLPCASMSPTTISWIRSSFIQFQVATSSNVSATRHAGSA